MASITPISVALSDLSSLSPGDLLPTLLRINVLLDQHLPEIDRSLQNMIGVLQPLLTNISVLENGQLQILGTSLRVFETNPDLLDHIEAGRWAIAYLSYNLMVELLEILRGIRWRLGQVIPQLEELNGAVAMLDADLNAIGNCVCSVLQEILRTLQTGMQFNGVLTIRLDAGSLGNIFNNIDLARLLALLGIAAGFVVLLALALASLVAFVTALGAALQTFTLTSIAALAAITAFVFVLTQLVEVLGRMDWQDLIGVAFGLAALGIFVYALSRSLSELNGPAMIAAAAMSVLIYSLQSLAAALGAMDGFDIIGMAVGLAALGLFVYYLGQSLSGLNASAMIAAVAMTILINALQGLAMALGAMAMVDIIGMAIGLAALGLFVYGLAYAVNQLTQQSIGALPALGEFITTLSNLATTLGGMSGLDLLGMAVALALIALFVYGLGQALGTFTQQAVDAMGPLTGLIGSLNSLIATVSALDVGSLFAMGAAFALITAFMFGMGAALNYAVPGLTALAAALAGINTLVSSVSAGISRLSSAIGSLPSIGEMGISLPSFDQGGVMPQTGLALLHAGERVLTPSETSALDQARLSVMAAPAAAGLGAMDRSVHVGTINITIQAGNLEPGSGQQLSDEIVRSLQERLSALRNEQDFRSGVRTPAPA